MIKNKSSQSSNFQSLLIQKISSPLKSLSLSSQKLLDTYKAKNFEYISFKDFKQMLLTLEQMNKQIQKCYESAQELSGSEAFKVQEGSCNINQVINDIIHLLKSSLFNSKIKTTIRLDSSIPLVNINALDGHQVIHNLLTNSMNAMPGRGEVKIRTKFEDSLKAVIVEISDNGVGMSNQRLAKVFEPFVMTQEQDIEKSSGLGLSVVYGIVKNSGGTINIYSSQRKGTQVRILLPAVQ